MFLATRIAVALESIRDVQDLVLGRDAQEMSGAQVQRGAPGLIPFISLWVPPLLIAVISFPVTARWRRGAVEPRPPLAVPSRSVSQRPLAAVY